MMETLQYFQIQFMKQIYRAEVIIEINFISYKNVNLSLILRSKNFIKSCIQIFLYYFMTLF